MQAGVLKKDIFWVGVLDKDLRVFDILMETKYGTTYNAYVIRGSEKTAIVDTVKDGFFDDYWSKICDIDAAMKIDYIIVNHTEPDHAGSILRVLQLFPDIVVLGTHVAIQFLKEIVNQPFAYRIIKENDTLSLGNKTIHFMVVPNMHWPDTMYSYIVEDKVLFTCDSFGAHYCFDGVLLSRVTDMEPYKEALKYYYDCIFSPFKAFSLRALKRIEALPIDLVCTGHGAVIDQQFNEICALYKEWSTPLKKDRKQIVIPYVSAYGYTKALAQEIVKGIEASGGIDVLLFDMVECKQEEVVPYLEDADGYLFGSPTILGDALKPIWDITAHLIPAIHGGKPASAFGSYGWSGEGVPHLMERLKQLRMKTCEGFRVKFQPNEQDLQNARAFGAAFAELVKLS